VVVIGLVALFSPLIARYPYAEQHYDAIMAAPSATYFFGTDEFGRDIFSRIVEGARISLMVGFFSVIIGTGAGAVLGLVSGYFMGKFDAVTQRLVDIWMSFPDLILALTIVAVFGNTLDECYITRMMKLGIGEGQSAQGMSNPPSQLIGQEHQDVMG
jgi:ABC-type dipeptide/oligopeptide/nickel transport system permease subunit